MNLTPDYANIKKGDKTIKVDPNSVKIDDIIIIKPGEKVPLDGVIISGNSTINTSALTGESLPLEVKTKMNLWSYNISGLWKRKVKSD